MRTFPLSRPPGPKPSRSNPVPHQTYEVITWAAQKLTDASVSPDGAIEATLSDFGWGQNCAPASDEVLAQYVRLLLIGGSDQNMRVEKATALLAERGVTLTIQNQHFTLE